MGSNNKTKGCTALNDFGNNLLKQFGLYGRAVKERGKFFCKTDFGMAKIYKTYEGQQAVKNRQALLAKLGEAGFTQTDALPGALVPCVQAGRELYAIARDIKGRVLDLNQPEDIYLGIEAIGALHRAGRGGDFKLHSTAPLLGDTFEKNTAFLIKCAKDIGKMKKLSDLDILLMRNLPKYIDMCHQATKMLNRTQHITLHQEAVANHHVCHNILREDNLHIADGVCYITNFNWVSTGLQLLDFAEFLRRYARRSNQEIPLEDLVAAYGDICPLPPTGAEIIHAYLAHPWQFVKVTQHYFSKKRSWVQSGIIGKMERALEEQDGYDKYVQVNFT